MFGDIKFELPEDAKKEITSAFVESAGNAFQELIKKQSFPPYMNGSQAASYCGVSYNTFSKWGAPIIEIEGIRRYSRRQLDEFLEEHSC